MFSLCEPFLKQTGHIFCGFFSVGGINSKKCQTTSGKLYSGIFSTPVSNNSRIKF